MGEDGGGCGGSGSGEVVQGKKQTGKVKWFNNMKGFGFITADEGGEELFVHQSSILCEGYRSLTEGEEVEFEVEEGEDQRTRAVHVTGPCGAPVQASNNSSRGNNSSRSSARGGGGTRGGYSAQPSYGGYSGGGASQSYGGYSNNQSSYGYGPGSGCYNCGEIGHIARECPVQDGVTSGSSRRGGRTCYTCGEMGHIARDCPSKDDPQDQIGRQFSSLTV